MKIVLMGCGRVGARLARLFEQAGHEVSIIDLKAESFARLGPDFRGSTLAGTGIDEDVLRAAGIRGADVFLAVSNQDNANIMAAQIARLMFQVPRVIARIYEPDREAIYHDMGLETICPTTLVSNRVYEAISTGADAHTAGIQPARAAGGAESAAHPSISMGAGRDDQLILAPGQDDRNASHLGHSLRQRFFR